MRERGHTTTHPSALYNRQLVRFAPMSRFARSPVMVLRSPLWRTYVRAWCGFQNIYFGHDRGPFAVVYRQGPQLLESYTRPSPRPLVRRGLCLHSVRTTYCCPRGECCCCCFFVLVFLLWLLLAILPLFLTCFRGGGAFFALSFRLALAGRTKRKLILSRWPSAIAKTTRTTTEPPGTSNGPVTAGSNATTWRRSSRFQR